MSYKIDLALFNTSVSTINWEYGNVYHFPNSKEQFNSEIAKIIKALESDYVLFWDMKISLPNIENLNELCSYGYDVMHGAYWDLNRMEPRYLNYVNPLWIYNLQADLKIEFSSFRSTNRNTLIKTKAYKKLAGFSNQFNTVEFEFLDLGYRILKEGGIIRYSPVLNLEKKIISDSFSSADNTIFIKRHFAKKWKYYAEFRSFFSQKTTFKAADKESVEFKATELIQKQKPDIGDLHNFSISVLAPTLDRYYYIQNTIDQLQRQILKPLEILITDQTDQDKRQKLKLDNLEVPVKYILQESKGQVIAWNKLINEAKGDYLLFLGDDADKIYPNFCFDLAKSLLEQKSDMMAARVVEKGIMYADIPSGIKMSDTFPITLIKKDIVLKAGCFNMFFNKGIRADADLAIRCHLNGALMLLNNDVEIFHHRAPSGGLRAHKQRKTTYYMSQNNITDYVIQTETEFYIAYKYFTINQINESNFSRKIALFTVKGNLLKKILKVLFILSRFYTIHKKIRINKVKAKRELGSFLNKKY